MIHLTVKIQQKRLPWEQLISCFFPNKNQIELQQR